MSCEHRTRCYPTVTREPRAADLIRHPVAGVGGERDFHTIVHIEPFRVMISLREQHSIKAMGTGHPIFDSPAPLPVLFVS